MAYKIKRKKDKKSKELGYDKNRRYDQIMVNGKWLDTHPKKEHLVWYKGKWKKVYYKIDGSGEFRFKSTPTIKEKRKAKIVNKIVREIMKG